jgi:hypothetical protein
MLTMGEVAWILTPSSSSLVGIHVGVLVRAALDILAVDI